MKHKQTLAALLLCVLALGGCADSPIKQESDTVTYDMPSFDAEYEAPEGDFSGERNLRVTLYCVSTQQELTETTRSIRVEKDENVYVKVLTRLLEASSVVPNGTRVRSVSLSGTGYALVDLSNEVLSLTAQELAKLRLAIAMTLTRFEEISSVSVLVDGREETGLVVPTGAISPTDSSFTAYWAQLQSDETTNGAISRTVPLYFAAEYGKMLLCEMRTLRFEDGDFITPVVEALLSGPSSTPLAQRTLPSGKLLTEEGAQIVTSRDGRKLIELHVRNDFVELLAQQKLDFDTVCASLAYTLCRFVPETDGILLIAGDVALTSSAITVSDDPDRFGCLVTVYSPNENDKLTAESKVLSQTDALSKRSLLEQIENGVTDADLIAVSALEDTALVNLSADFYRQCQTLSATQERLLVYAMVNTLTQDSAITQVQFFVDGEYADTLGGTISIRGPLLRNPGLIE